MEKLYIKDILKELDMPEYVLRFYDKKGLFPFFERDENKQDPLDFALWKKIRYATF